MRYIGEDFFISAIELMNGSSQTWHKGDHRLILAYTGNSYNVMYLIDGEIFDDKSFLTLGMARVYYSHHKATINTLDKKGLLQEIK